MDNTNDVLKTRTVVLSDPDVVRDPGPLQSLRPRHEMRDWPAHRSAILAISITFSMVQTQLSQYATGAFEMNSQEIPSKLIVSGGDASEVLEPAEAALDDIWAFVGPFVEAMDDECGWMCWGLRVWRRD
ncbi:hypothetical protein ABIA06_002918 [Bradyrhizobium yuanmingense]|uniref:hypothetical protein n=1 Tax=Bradyrhizobium yuanmingense TaxID=108015 RepID=UPI00351425A3